jgi:2-polyprenyl-3-methyl-5-hydroxy-6-metoxy-1,4-benzoquinol methylase
MSEYQDYGWKEGSTYHHNYLYNDLKSILNGKNKRYLDVGCGNGGIALRLLEEGYDVYGIDASITGIDIAKKSQPDRFHVQDINTGELPATLDNIFFDTIISTEVIEHLYNPRNYIAFCKHVLMKMGVVT